MAIYRGCIYFATDIAVLYDLRRLLPFSVFVAFEQNQEKQYILYSFRQ